MSLTWGFVCNSGYSRQGKVGRDRGTRSEFEREDFEAEKARLDREIGKAHAEIAKVDAKLANPDFVARAPEEIVVENQERREASLARVAELEAARARLAGI